MDTPEKNQIGTPISKFEDSPVFNYINNLSPIKPVKSVHIAQTFHSLSFASLPSVFTSPHTTYQKESRFLVRHHLSDFSKAVFSSDNGDESNTSADISDGDQLSDRLAGTQENFNSVSSIKEVTVDPPNEHSKLPAELPQTLKYDCGSPNSNATPSYGVKMDPKIEISGTPASIVQFVQDGPIERHHSFESEVELRRICEHEKTKEEEAEGCEWEKLISDVADELLIFDPSTEAEACKGQVQNKVDRDAGSLSSVVSKLPQDNSDDSQKAEPIGSLGSFHQLAIHDGAVDPVDLGEQKVTNKTSHLLPSGSQNEEGTSDPSDKIGDKAGDCIAFGCKVEAQQHRGMRRRCLVFEMAGAPKKNLEDDSNSSSSISLQSEAKFASDNKQLVPLKPTIGSSSRMLPGIGLHLNSLATTSKDCRIVNQETLSSGRRLISLPSSVPSFHSLTAGRRPLNKSVGSNSSERDLGLAGNEVQVMQEASGATAIGTGEEFNQSSPKKKRRRLENAGENEACKRCNCKKSKCLKLYCECFAAGVYCVEPCSCQECFNKPVHEDTVLATRKQIESRNPLAFAPKVIRSTEPVPDIGEEVNTTPASARHKRGCNCKKSSCLKKYCECYQGGVGCSSHCRCEGCKNAFGRKDGTAPIGIEEAEAEEEETEDRAKVGLDGSLQIIEAQKDEQQNSEGVLPVTPSFKICRPPVNLPLLSSGKPPRSSLHAVGSSPRLKTCQTLRKFENMYPQPKFEKHFQINSEDETPEILRVNCSPTNGVKNASPKGKRVSPPHNENRLSPGRRNGRKLILQSIPSFPSLTRHGSDDFIMKYR